MSHIGKLPDKNRIFNGRGTNDTTRHTNFVKPYGGIYVPNPTSALNRYLDCFCYGTYGFEISGVP